MRPAGRPRVRRSATGLPWCRATSPKIERTLMSEHAAEWATSIVSHCKSRYFFQDIKVRTGTGKCLSQRDGFGWASWHIPGAATRGIDRISGSWPTMPPDMTGSRPI